MQFFKSLTPFAVKLGLGFGLGLGLCSQASALEDYVWGNVRFDGGGFVSAVMPSAQVEGLWYARTDVGGVYRWESTSNRWIPLMDWVSQNDVGLYGTESFALDPTDPAKLYILAGTGYFSEGRTAIFRSSDYGATFDTSYVDFYAHGNGMGRQTGEKLVVDPNSPNILLCGSRTKGLYKSEDSGKTWSNIYEVALSSATGTSLNNVNGISFVLFDATAKLSDGSTGTVYLGISETSDNFQVSQDGGKTWTVISGGPSGLMPHRAKFAGTDLIITFADGPGPHSINSGAVYRYAPSTGTWTDITPFEDESTTARVTYPFGGVSVDPTDANHIVVTTICHYGGRHHFADETDGWGDKIYVTTDGGKTWKHGQGYNDGVNVDAGDNQWIHGNAIHWAGSIEFDPFDTKKAWVTSGNGVFHTDDITAAVPLWKFESQGIEETVPLDIVSVPGGPLVTAIGDYDGAAYSNIEASTPRHQPIIGTTQSLGYAPLTGNFLRAGTWTVYGQYEAITSNVMYFSSDNAATWDTVPVVKAAHGLVVLSADGKVFLHRGEGLSTVYRSTDGGNTWTEAAGLQGTTNYSKIVPDPVNAKVFYVMDSQGQLVASTDAGENFANTGASLNDNASGHYYNGAGIIRTVPGREGHIWVPLDQAQQWLAKGYSENGLAYTENAGESWTYCSNVSTAIAVGIGKAAEGADYETIYIWGIAGGADNPLGIYRSTDKGETWERINDDAHQYGGPGNGNFVVGDMNHFGVVYMSTVGRGLVVGAPKGSILPIPTIQMQEASIVSMQLSARNLRVSGPAESLLLLFDAQGKLCLQKRIGANSEVSLEKLPAGKVLARVVSKDGKALHHQSLTLR